MEWTDKMTDIEHESKREYTRLLADFLDREVVYYAPGEWEEIPAYRNSEIVVIDREKAINVTWNSTSAIRDEVCREIYGNGATGRIIKKETTPEGAESNPRDKYITERKENGN